MLATFGISYELSKQLTLGLEYKHALHVQKIQNPLIINGIYYTLDGRDRQGYDFKLRTLSLSLTFLI